MTCSAGRPRRVSFPASTFAASRTCTRPGISSSACAVFPFPAAVLSLPACLAHLIGGRGFQRPPLPHGPAAGAARTARSHALCHEPAPARRPARRTLVAPPDLAPPASAAPDVFGRRPSGRTRRDARDHALAGESPAPPRLADARARDGRWSPSSSSPGCAATAAPTTRGRRARSSGVLSRFGARSSDRHWEELRRFAFGANGRTGRRRPMRLGLAGGPWVSERILTRRLFPERQRRPQAPPQTLDAGWTRPCTPTRCPITPTDPPQSGQSSEAPPWPAPSVNKLAATVRAASFRRCGEVPDA